MKEKAKRNFVNIFEAVGAERPAVTFVRAQVMSRIAEIVEERGLTQKQAAALPGIPQSKVSCLMNGKCMGRLANDQLCQNRLKQI